MWEPLHREKGRSLAKLGAPDVLFRRFPQVPETIGFDALCQMFTSSIQPVQSRFEATQPGLGDLAQKVLQPVTHQQITFTRLFSAQLPI
jgi:hypothetical protein